MDSEKIERVYAAYSGFYDLIFGRLFDGSRAKAVRLLNIQNGETVLEVGVGTGLSLPFYPGDCKVVGIDFCGPMLEKSRRRLRQRPLPHIELQKMDAMKMDFADSTFDSVFAAYVISAVSDPHRVISEMIRVCKPGGKIVLLNHFQNGNRIISACEKVVSPLCKKLGFRADLDLATLLKGKPLMVERKLKVKPFNYWKVVRCVNHKEGKVSEANHTPRFTRFSKTVQLDLL